MGTVPALPLSDVVDVVIQVSPLLPATPTFNQGLIVGSSTVIPSVLGSNPRIRLYTSLAAMLSDGFTLSSPEYVAAAMYFGNGAQYLWVGRQDLTALQTITIDAAGTDWNVGDKFNVVQGGGSLGIGVVTAETGGIPSAISIVPGVQGTGYADATNLTTAAISPSTGTDLTVNITAIGETCLQAVQACRTASPNWWAVVALNAIKADNIAIGEWAQAQVPQCMYMYTTADADALAGTTGNVFSVLKAGNYSRAFGIFSTTQSGLYPNNIYAAVAAMGVAMGLNTGLANSFFTMKFKTLVGISPEPWTETSKNTVEGNNGNIYVNYGNAYTWLEQGVVADGQFFDEILNFDMLASDYQYSVINVLVSQPSVPQTNPGQTEILNAIDGANQRAATRGFLAGGIWSGNAILNLQPGQPLPNGYLSQSPSITTLSPSDKQARKSAPVYVAIIEAGAIHSVLIGVYVQR